MGRARICRGDYVLVVAWLWCGGFFFFFFFFFFNFLIFLSVVAGA